MSNRPALDCNSGPKEAYTVEADVGSSYNLTVCPELRYYKRLVIVGTDTRAVMRHVIAWERESRID